MDALKSDIFDGFCLLMWHQSALSSVSGCPVMVVTSRAAGDIKLG